ncbi:flagellar M-ring protein FliF [Pseudomonas nitritireducens]|uniref:Flagellar M-ring protein n=1 Tax=Pseudomonas nitroreducens TaxID=46680 RepID=A0A7W7P329_PSENT|nr:flagellar basal-body MS-ring/collar protein FliF [Pseudomonas nitritireducens]MBB4865399.1 flagellar M-ring protein FliF [Pseudomonas nitritireducens]
MANQNQVPLDARPAGFSIPTVRELVQQIKAKPLVPLMFVGAAVIAIGGGALMWAGNTDYQVMYSNLSESDGGKIIAELDKRGVPYKLTQNGHTLMVPAEQVYPMRLSLAQDNLPEGGNVGFELMDKQGFGTSQFAEHVNFQRSLEGELAKTIQSLSPVERARVHLVLPKDSVFVRNREPASASVTLHLKSGRELGPGQIEAIVHMVSSSVQGLPAESVTVVDQTGRLLSKNASSMRELNEEKLAYADEIESIIQKRIETILTPILGRQNVKAQVVAQIDYSAREHTSELYAPNQPPNEAAIRSQQTSENFSGDGNSAKGVPGALTNSAPNSPPLTTPDGKPNPAYPAPKAEVAKAAAGEDSTLTNLVGTNSTLRRDKTTNYEVNKTVEHVRNERGEIQRLSAAVVVNFKEETTEEGETKQVPLTSEELEQVKKLVRQAMGFSSERGDEVEVINSQFTKIQDITNEDPWWKTPEFFNLATSIARYVVIAILLLLAWIFVGRPIKRRMAENSPEAIAARARAAQEAAEAYNGAVMPIHQAVGPDGEPLFDEAGNPIEVQTPATPRRRKLSYQQNLDGLQQMAKNEPHIVAAVFAEWLKREQQQNEQ